MSDFSVAAFVIGIALITFAIGVWILDPLDTRAPKRRMKEFAENNKYWKPDDMFINLKDYRENPRQYTSYKLVTWKPDGSMMLKKAYSGDELTIYWYKDGWVNTSYNARKKNEEKDKYIMESLNYVSGIENFQKILERTQKEWVEKSRIASEEMDKATAESLKELFEKPITEYSPPTPTVESYDQVVAESAHSSKKSEGTV